MKTAALLVTLNFFWGCTRSAELLEVHSKTAPVDVAFVPGCPAELDGSLSFCLKRRIVWAAHLWHLGITKNFITSGAATYNRFVEAEALATGLVALDVPKSHIWVEAHARHTDENMYYSMQIAEQLTFDTIAVASESGQARGGCSFLQSWNRECVAASMDTEFVHGELASRQHPLHIVKIQPIDDPDWLMVFDFEREREEKGGPRRPGSLALYLWWAPLMGLFGNPWIPPAAASTKPVPYATFLNQRSQALNVAAGAGLSP